MYGGELHPVSLTGPYVTTTICRCERGGSSIQETHRHRRGINRLGRRRTALPRGRCGGRSRGHRRIDHRQTAPSRAFRRSRWRRGGTRVPRVQDVEVTHRCRRRHQTHAREDLPIPPNPPRTWTAGPRSNQVVSNRRWGALPMKWLCKGNPPPRLSEEIPVVARRRALPGVADSSSCAGRSRLAWRARRPSGLYRARSHREARGPSSGQGRGSSGRCANAFRMSARSSGDGCSFSISR